MSSLGALGCGSARYGLVRQLRLVLFSFGKLGCSLLWQGSYGGFGLGVFGLGEVSHGL